MARQVAEGRSKIHWKVCLSRGTGVRDTTHRACSGQIDRCAGIIYTTDLVVVRRKGGASPQKRR